MAEKIRIKGQLKLPVVGRNPIFAQMKFVKVALSEPDILPDSGSIFTCDEQGNYDFEIYTGKHLLSYNVGNSWSKQIEIIAEPLADGLESIEISDLIGFQEIPELDATIAALNQQKQELLLIQQDVSVKQSAAASSASAAAASAAQAEILLEKSVQLEVNNVTGNDATADGTTSKPFATIKAAIESTDFLAKVIIVLREAASKESAHVIDKTISVGKRTVEIAAITSHIVVTAAAVFSLEDSGSVYTTTGWGSITNLHCSEDVTFALCRGSADVRLGDYTCNIYIPDDKTFTVASNSLSPTKSTISVGLSGVRLLTEYGTNGNATMIGINGGSGFVTVSSSSLGNNYTHGASIGYYTQLVSGLYAVAGA